MPNPPLEFLKPSTDLRNLKLLEEISKEAKISQRKLARRLGVALGVTNACLKKMIKKGFIKVKGISNRRIIYYLSPKGFSEKTRLTYYFLQHTISYYVSLKKKIYEKLRLLEADNVKRIIYYGAGEVMEVAFITLHETNLELVGIIDDDGAKHGKKKFGFVISAPAIIKELKPDAIFITSLKFRDEILNNLENDESLRQIRRYSLD
ncbi:MAG: winged helix-turn-helix transcriptional regulator [Candidatus Omnitrophota bacterium]